MKIRSLIILPIIALLFFARAFTFCSYKYDCPAYNDSAWVKWVPYTKGQVIIFTNGSTGRDTIHINSVTKSDASSGKTSGEKKFDCNSEAAVKSTELSANRDPALWITNNRSEIPTASVLIELHQLRIFAYDISDIGIISEDDTRFLYQSFTNYTLGNHIYPTLQSIAKTDTSTITSSQPYKIFFAPGVGIAGYELYPSHEIWSLK